MNNSVAPSWAYWEKHKHRAVIALAILTSAAIASAARNERRMFVLPEELIAFAAVPGGAPAAVRSPVSGYLDDGCEPEMDASGASFQRAIDEADCGEDRKREPEFAVIPRPDPEPIAFFAMPDVPILIDAMEIPELPEETPPYQRIAMFGRTSLIQPGRTAALTPPILAPGVPEPRSWALMIQGFLLAGATLRRFPFARGAVRRASMRGEDRVADSLKRTVRT